MKKPEKPKEEPTEFETVLDLTNEVSEITGINYVHKDIESYISNARFGNVDFQYFNEL